MTISDNINWRHTLYFTLSLIISPYLTVTPKYHFEMLYLCIVTQKFTENTEIFIPMNDISMSVIAIFLYGNHFCDFSDFCVT